MANILDRLCFATSMHNNTLTATFSAEGTGLWLSRWQNLILYEIFFLFRIPWTSESFCFEVIESMKISSYDIDRVSSQKYENALVPDENLWLYRTSTSPRPFSQLHTWPRKKPRERQCRAKDLARIANLQSFRMEKQVMTSLWTSFFRL